MKKIALALIIFTFALQAQPLQSTKNSTTTLLGSSATFNGSIEAVSLDYNWVMVVVKSNKNSATDGLVVRWTDKDATPITYKTIDKRTYTANDTLNGTNVYRFPVAGSYFKVSYTNTNSAQTGTFSLKTYLIKSVAVTDGEGTIGLVANNSLTVSTEVDSLTIVAPSGKYSFSYKSIDDTTEVAFSNTFANPIRVLPYEGFTLKNLSLTVFPKAFIRRKGGAGTCTYDYSYTVQ